MLLECAKVCTIVSCFAVILFSAWGCLLMTHAIGSFTEIPAAHKETAGMGCFAAAAIYSITAVLSMVYSVLYAKHTEGTPASTSLVMPHPPGYCQDPLNLDLPKDVPTSSTPSVNDGGEKSKRRKSPVDRFPHHKELITEMEPLLTET